MRPLANNDGLAIAGRHLPRNQLVLFFVGSGGTPPQPSAPFVQHARKLGFHFFGVSYPDAPSVGAFCEGSAGR